MTYISFEKYGPEYKQLWNTMKIIRDASELQRVSDKIKQYQEVYKKVQQATGVPWQMVAVIHLREAGEQDIGRWQCVLHNGERIVGTNKLTKLVPANRGPFPTWHEAALDALRMKGFDKVKSWPIERMLWAMEPYNGYGYRNKGLRSPYIWASTNHQQSGKYIRDGVFDPDVIDTQVGCAAQLKYLGVGISTGLGPVAGPIATGGGLAMMWPEYIIPILIGTVVLSIAAYLVVKWYKKRIQPKVLNTNVEQNKDTVPVDQGPVGQV